MQLERKSRQWSAIAIIVGFLAGIYLASSSGLSIFFPTLIDGVQVTIVVSILSFVLFILMSFVAATGRIYGGRVTAAVSIVYVEVFRGTSLLVQLFWLFFVLPELGIVLEPITAAVVGIGLNFGAYGAEVVRGAIAAVPRAQTEACIALNISPRRRVTRILIPQAIGTMIPGMTNLTIELIKATSMVSAVTLVDLTRAAVNLNLQHFRTLEIFVITLILYYCLCQLVRFGSNYLEALATHYRRGGT